MKKLYIILGIILVVIIALFFVYRSFTKSYTTPALLYIESGNVEVDSGSGWQQAVNEMELKSNYKVRTIDGLATIAFYEGELVRLSANTEVLISELRSSSVKLEQNTGETWNRVTKLTGTRDYEIKTPQTVATVRGTAWNMKMKDNLDEVLVGESTVFVTSNTNNENQDVQEFNKVEISSEGIKSVPLTKEDYTLLKKNLGHDIDIMKKLRLREAYKNKIIAKEIEKRSSGDISSALEALDSGQMDLDELEKKVPIKLESVAKIRKLTEKIIELKKEAEQLQ